MTTDLISHQLVRYLEYRDVKHVFGLCGHTNIAVLAALSKSESIEFVNTRHEQLAAHAADGYARASKRASVVPAIALSKVATSTSAEKMSIGTLTRTGPGRPLSASRNALSMISANRCADSTRQARFTNGR